MTTQESPQMTAVNITERNAAICTIKKATSRSNGDIGKQFGISSERVRQIIYQEARRATQKARLQEKLKRWNAEWEAIRKSKRSS
jgi:DNA-directed RNA polymerase sigma subunit (sigma70/sigma32)